MDHKMRLWNCGTARKLRLHFQPEQAELLELLLKFHPRLALFFALLLEFCLRSLERSFFHALLRDGPVGNFLEDFVPGGSFPLTVMMKLCLHLLEPRLQRVE